MVIVTIYCVLYFFQQYNKENILFYKCGNDSNPVSFKVSTGTINRWRR